ncbi:MAG: hypothetical protein AB1454_02025 [Candidatus Auribacterota bacterium]
MNEVEISTRNDRFRDFFITLLVNNVGIQVVFINFICRIDEHKLTYYANRSR